MAELFSHRCMTCGTDFETETIPSTCPNCGHEGSSYDFPATASLTIAAQNDEFRKFAIGIESPLLKGSFVMTEAVSRQSTEFIISACIAIASYTDFTEDNDPYRDHGFGIINVEDEKLYWKIVLYDNTMNYGSPAPTDPSQTFRVLTLMFPSDY